MIRLAVLLLCFASVARAQADVRVIDGDSIVLNGMTVRLHGIDAPELSQTCENGWRAGEYARAVLTAIIGRTVPRCESKGQDRYGRTIAICFSEGVDIGAEMVRQGQAWAYLKYSNDYAYQMHVAKSQGLGIWGAGCQPAWDFRKERR